MYPRPTRSADAWNADSRLVRGNDLDFVVSRGLFDERQQTLAFIGQFGDVFLCDRDKRPDCEMGGVARPGDFPAACHGPIDQK